MIIKSLLSTDFYKFTMLQVFFREFPDVVAKYKFKCRNKDVNLLPFKEEIEEEIDKLCTLKFTEDELNYLGDIRFFTPSFINYLEDFNLKRRYITVGEKDGEFNITAEGPICQSSMFEIYVLKIVHEVYSRNVNPMSEALMSEGRDRLARKIHKYKAFATENGWSPVVIDFGGRRAFSCDWHEYVVRNLINCGVIKGTSDVYLAKKFGIKPIGTMAHEFITLFQGLVHPMDSQKKAFETWLKTYGSDLGIVLSDSLGDDKFLKDFGSFFANGFTGCRHDSGDPFVWGDKIIKHYESMNIDPLTKTLVFSDGLDFDKVFELEKYFNGKIKISHGVGTNLSNDLGILALQNVFKQVEVNGRPVAKLSNNPSKTMCEDKTYLDYLKSCLNKI